MSTSKGKQPTFAADLFHPVEHAILANYLCVEPPKCTKDINPERHELEKTTYPIPEENRIEKVDPETWTETHDPPLEYRVTLKKS